MDSKGRVFISRNVVFDEAVFPFAQKTKDAKAPEFVDEQSVEVPVVPATNGGVSFSEPAAVTRDSHGVGSGAESEQHHDNTESSYANGHLQSFNSTEVQPSPLPCSHILSSSPAHDHASTDVSELPQ
ncbi:hypothetical protein V6N11_081922 [Hibiscus sabdariffa]|uniref:Uncharacterized protein n=1 Tax=Hibiscus sabdariffa TaxID=183260 RepID=A0ABR2Q7L1_9ROSI